MNLRWECARQHRVWFWHRRCPDCRRELLEKIELEYIIAKLEARARRLCGR